MLLTPAQLDRRDKLEEIVKKNKKAFLHVCNALRSIHDEGLWRETHVRFTDYCQERLGLDITAAWRWVTHSRIVEEMRNGCPDLPAPANYGQTQILAPLAPEDRKIVWEDAVERQGGQPTLSTLSESRQRLNELMEKSSQLVGEGRRELIERVRNEEMAADRAGQDSLEKSEQGKVTAALKRGLENLGQLVRMCRRIGCEEEARLCEEIIHKMKRRLDSAYAARQNVAV